MPRRTLRRKNSGRKMTGKRGRKVVLKRRTRKGGLNFKNVTDAVGNLKNTAQKTLTSATQQTTDAVGNLRTNFSNFKNTFNNQAIDTMFTMVISGIDRIQNALEQSENLKEKYTNILTSLKDNLTTLKSDKDLMNSLKQQANAASNPTNNNQPQPVNK